MKIYTSINEFKQSLIKENIFDQFDITIIPNKTTSQEELDTVFNGYTYTYNTQNNEIIFMDVTDPDMDQVYDKLDELFGEDEYKFEYHRDGDRIEDITESKVNESNEMRGYRSFEYDIKNKTLEQTDAGVASELSIQDYDYDYDNDKAILDLPEDKESIKRIFNSGIIHLPYMSTHYGHNEIKELCDEWVLKNWSVSKGVDISESTDISLGKIVTLQDGHTYEITKIENNIYTLAPELGKSITLSKEELIRKLEFINEKLSEIDKAKREWEKIKPRVESMYLKLKEQAAKCSDFGTITVRMPQFRPNDNEVFIYQYSDRIFRHPDEYGARGRKAENSPKYQKFEELLFKLDQFISDKMGKYGVGVDISA